MSKSEDLKLLKDRVTVVWAKYQGALTRLADANVQHAAALDHYNERKNYLIIKGVEGSNAEIRKATLETELAHEAEVVKQAQLGVEASKLYLEIQQAEVSELRMILKIAEFQYSEVE